jgi:hypothetical protein
MTRRRMILIAVAGGLALAIGLGAWDRDIDAKTATVMADKLAVQYFHRSGESPRQFAVREARQWADGWEFRWRYRPCPENASLRIWISRNGRRANYAELPECETPGLSTPRKA